MSNKMSSTFRDDGYADAVAGRKAAPVDQGIHGQEYMEGFNDGLREAQAKPRSAAAALIELCDANEELFSSLPGDLYAEGMNHPEASLVVPARVSDVSITNEFELDSFASPDDDPDFADQITIVLAMTLTAEGQETKPMAMLSMDYHQSEVGVNDRHWISLKADPALVEADFRREALGWGVSPGLVDKGVEYIGKCRALVADLGDRVEVSDLGSPVAEVAHAKEVGAHGLSSADYADCGSVEKMSMGDEGPSAESDAQAEVWPEFRPDPYY